MQSSQRYIQRAAYAYALDLKGNPAHEGRWHVPWWQAGSVQLSGYSSCFHICGGSSRPARREEKVRSVRMKMCWYLFPALLVGLGGFGHDRGSRCQFGFPRRLFGCWHQVGLAAGKVASQPQATAADSFTRSFPV